MSKCSLGRYVLLLIVAVGMLLVYCYFNSPVRVDKVVFCERMKLSHPHQTHFIVYNYKNDTKAIDSIALEEFCAVGDYEKLSSQQLSFFFYEKTINTTKESLMCRSGSILHSPEKDRIAVYVYDRGEEYLKCYYRKKNGLDMKSQLDLVDCKIIGSEGTMNLINLGKYNG